MPMTTDNYDVKVPAPKDIPESIRERIAHERAEAEARAAHAMDAIETVTSSRPSKTLSPVGVVDKGSLGHGAPSNIHVFEDANGNKTIRETKSLVTPSKGIEGIHYGKIDERIPGVYSVGGQSAVEVTKKEKETYHELPMPDENGNLSEHIIEHEREVERTETHYYDDKGNKLNKILRKTYDDKGFESTKAEFVNKDHSMSNSASMVARVASNGDDVRFPANDMKQHDVIDVKPYDVMSPSVSGIVSGLSAADELGNLTNSQTHMPDSARIAMEKGLAAAESTKHEKQVSAVEAAFGSIPNSANAPEASRGLGE